MRLGKLSRIPANAMEMLTLSQKDRQIEELDRQVTHIVYIPAGDPYSIDIYRQGTHVAPARSASCCNY